MSLVEQVCKGQIEGVVRELESLTPAERRACLPELKQLRKERRADAWHARGDGRALLIAGVGCNTSATAAAAWLGGSDFGGGTAWSHPALLAVVADRPPEWQAAVVAKLAERRSRSWWGGEYGLLEHLVRTTGCAVPTSDAFVTQWIRDRTWQNKLPGHLTGVTGATLWDRLSVDPFVPVLVPRLFEVADIGAELDRGWHGTQPGGGWPACLARLTEQGVLDRGEMIDRCVARLLRGGRAVDQRAFLVLLQTLAPTTEENAARARSYVALLDTLSTVAAHAQQVLGELDEAGLLAADLLGDASATVLFRTEKKLVRAQLGLLDRAARRDRAMAGPVVLAAADAFGHPDPELQDRALKLTARHLAAAGDGVLPQLRAAAEALNPAHSARAAELFGAAARPLDEVYEEYLPPVPQPQEVPGPLGTPAEVAEELGAILAGDADVVAFERALDGLVRHAYLDRAALAEALEPVLRATPWSSWWIDCTAGDIWYVATAVAGPKPGGALRKHRSNSLFGDQLADRLEEAARQILAGGVPFLLATPTSATGALEAAVLVERLAAYESLDARVGPADLSQALLRVAPTEDAEVLAAAGRLSSDAGRRTARWLTAGGLPRQPSQLVSFAPGREAGLDGWQAHILRDVVRTMVEQPGVVLEEPLTPDSMRLLGPVTHSAAGMFAFGRFKPARHWPAMLPHHREELAARVLGAFASVETRGSSELLPYLAEADGPVGPAVRLAVAYGLGARFPEDRAAAVDALLVLAARGDLDGAMLGRELAELVGVGAVKPNRLLDSVRAAAETGAFGTVWSVLAGLVPGLLAGGQVRGTADLLALAADCARRSVARGAIVEVSAAAARGGASRLVKQAKALEEVLSGV